MNWISVWDALPEKNEPVICYDFPETCKCWLCNDEKWHAFFGGRRLYAVTHWVTLADYDADTLEATDETLQD